MEKEILDIIESHPKHYSLLIRKDNDLRTWVEERTDDVDDWKTRIYTAVHNVDAKCPHGNRKKVHRWGDGLIGCGPASSCQCVNQKISQGVSATKKQESKLEKEKTNQKRVQTMLSKYGVAYNSQRKDIKHIWKKPKIDKDAFGLLTDKQWLIDQYNNKKRTLSDIGDELGVYYGTVGEYARSHGIEIRQITNRSQVEKDIELFLSNFDLNIITNDWTVLENKELDLFIPDSNLAIEVNGLFWHSWHPSIGINENKNRHLEKHQQCQEKNIRLIQLTDWHWKNKSDIVKSMLVNAIGMGEKINARKTSVYDLTTKQAREFFDANHISGFCGGNRHVGLITNDKPVMCMTLGRNRFQKDKSYTEILRMATDKNTVVVGGFSKLIHHIDTPLVSYVDLDWFTGSGYEKVGFEFVKNTDPGYFWTDGNKIISRYQSQHKNIKKWLPNYNSTLSESKNMFANQYRRYWTCGNGLWVYHP